MILSVYELCPTTFSATFGDVCLSSGLMGF